MKERLAHIRSTMERKGVMAFYAWYDSRAEFTIDTRDATEDILWMIAEIERLRVENNDLQSPRVSEFVQAQLKKRLAAEGPHGPSRAPHARTARGKNRGG